MESIILGSAQLGLDYGVNNSRGALTSEDVVELLKTAYDNGVRKIDTAIAYGEAHKNIGEYHKANPQKKFELITKLSSNDLDDLEKNIDDELLRTGLDSFYGVLFHKTNDLLDKPEALSRLKDLKRAGKIRKIGASIYDNDEFEKVLSKKEIELIQFPFNVLDNYTIRGKWINEAKNRNIELHVRSIFLQGLFFKDLNSFSGNLEQLKTVITDVHELSKETSISIEELSIGYVKMIKQIDGIIMGTETKEQLLENIHAFNGVTLDSAIRDQIEGLTVVDKSMLNPSNWKL